MAQSLTLQASNTIQGVAGTATTVTYTIFGTATGKGNSVNPLIGSVLAQGQLASSPGAIYTVPANTTTLVNLIWLANTSASPVTGISIYVNGTAAGNKLIPSLTIPGNGTATITGDGQYSIQDSNGAAYVATGVPNLMPIFAQTASVTVANTASELTLVGSGYGSLTLPANFFITGKTIKVTVSGVRSATAAPTIQIKVKLGSTTVLDSTAVTSGNQTNQAFVIQGWITCRSAGGSGTVFCQGVYSEVGNAQFGMANTGTQTIDTTTTQTVNVTVQWGTASSSNTITATNLILEDAT